MYYGIDSALRIAHTEMKELNYIGGNKWECNNVRIIACLSLPNAQQVSVICLQLLYVRTSSEYLVYRFIDRTVLHNYHLSTYLYTGYTQGRIQ